MTAEVLSNKTWTVAAEFKLLNVNRKPKYIVLQYQNYKQCEIGPKIHSVFSNAKLVGHKSVLDGYKKCQMD